MELKVLKKELVSMEIDFPICFHVKTAFELNQYTLFKSETEAWEVSLSESGSQNNLWVIPAGAVMDKLKVCAETANIISLSDYITAYFTLEEHISLAKSNMLHGL